MSVYMTEEEQLDAIKKWWKRNGNIVTVLLSLLLLCVAGYRYLNWHHEKVTQQASIAYENMMVAFSNQNNKGIRSYANELIKNYEHTIYADVAHLTLAKVYILKDKLNNANEELEKVATGSKVPVFKQIAKIRIARILAANKSYTDALEKLSSVDDNAYLPVINELKGDIYNAKGDYQEAMKSYHLALDQDKINGMGNLYLEMKTNELAIKNQSTISEEKKIQDA